MAVSPPSATPTESLHEFTYTEVHMGMPVRLVLHVATEEAAREAARAAFARVAALDDVMSDYRPQSELSRLNRSPGTWVPVSADLLAVLVRAHEIARHTDGAFDPTVGPLVALWRDARLTRVLPDTTSLADARSRVGWRHLEIDAARQSVRLARSGMALDLGGIAKGFILQAAVDLLRVRGVTRVMAQAGGDIVVGDAPPGRAGWRVQVPGASAAFTEHARVLVNAALAVSGPTFQFVDIDGVRYSHVVDSRTGVGLTTRRLVYVIADDGATADAYATAVGVVGTSRWPEVRHYSVTVD